MMDEKLLILTISIGVALATTTLANPAAATGDEAEADSATSATAAPPAARPADTHHASGSATLNVAGFAMFGPVLTGEYGGSISGALRVRGFSLGLLSHEMFEKEDRPSELVLHCGGFGAAVRGYPHEPLKGLYGGFGLDYLYVGFHNEVGQVDTHNYILLVGMEGGYRLDLGGLLLGLGGELGHTFGLDDSCEVLDGSDRLCVKDPIPSQLYGQAVVDLGLWF